MSRLQERETAPDVYNLFLAAVLFLSPWLFKLTNSQGKIDLWVTSAIIVILSLAAIIAYRDWEEWINVLMGVWLIASPWLLGFPHTRAMHLSIGFGVAIMRGTIDLSTKPGQGTIVTLRLPLTLAIIEGLLIRVGEGRYIIPLSAVEECVELTAEDERSRGRNFLNVRGNLVPFLRLRELLTASGSPDRHQKTIIISTGETRVGLVADQIIGNHQTVIKSLSKLHSDVTIFSGATILGDGTAALILDVAQLVTLAQSKVEKQHISEAA